LREASDSSCTFVFHHLLYAEAFTRTNLSTGDSVGKIPTIRTPKPARGTAFVDRGKLPPSLWSAVVAGGMVHLVVCLVTLKDEPRRSDAGAPGRAVNVGRAYKPDSPISQRPSPVPQPPPQAARQIVVDTGLSWRIEQGRSKADRLESELATLDSELEDLKSRLRRSETTIEDYERRMKLNVFVDEFAYKSAVDDHNRLVRRHNSLLTERGDKYDEYSRAVNDVNALVSRYNRGER
jgi:hypothetical protein